VQGLIVAVDMEQPVEASAVGVADDLESALARVSEERALDALLVGLRELLAGAHVVPQAHGRALAPADGEQGCLGGIGPMIAPVGRCGGRDGLAFDHICRTS